MRDWVVEVGQSRSRRRGRESEGDGDGDGVRIRVLDVRGAGVVLVRGMLMGGSGGGGTSAGGEGLRNWMLVGCGGRERERVRVESGMVVVVRAPVWEVEVRGERWGVGVEWRVDGGG